MSRLPIANLSKPFPPEDIEWRVGNISRDGSKCSLLAYITSRAVMDRLDAVVGPENWKDEYHPSPLGNGYECRLSIRMGDGSWITKVDGAEPTQIESIKGAYSDSLKRAAVKWGIGRYLYRLPLNFVPLKDKGEVYVRTKTGAKYATPKPLPEWALPITMRRNPEDLVPVSEVPDKVPPGKKPKKKASPKKQQSKPEPSETPKDEHWTKDRKWFCAALDKFGGYDDVSQWTIDQGWGKPSSWKTEQRRNFIIKLEKGEFHVGEKQ